MIATTKPAPEDSIQLIKEIRQQDNYTFQIVWNNGIINSYRLSDLQKKCPCAKCFDPASGQQRLNEKEVDPHVRAVRVQSAGRYAIRVEFTSGCSRGIYSFAFLRMLAKD